MKQYFIILFLIIFTLNVKATHNRAGEITFTQIGPLTFEITLVTFTDPTTIAHQQRTELYFSFSDNTQDTFPRISETLIDNNISSPPKKSRQGNGKHTKYASTSRNSARKRSRGQGR